MGNLIWQKCYGGSNFDYASSILPAADKGCYIGGYTQSNDGDVKNNNGNYDIWVIKVDSMGILEWQNNYGGTGTEEAYSIYKTFDDKIIVAGLSYSSDGDVSGNNGGRDAWIFKITSHGFLEWQKKEKP